MLKKKAKEFFLNGFLVFCAVLLSLIIAEIGLRIFLPKYQEAAEARLEREDFPKRVPNSQLHSQHPDTGKKHLLFLNNLGLRQSWDIDPVSGTRRFRVGVFGDSFVENAGMSVEYDFVNVLDYLLNSNEDKFEVINFGMNGYGTDDAYLSFLKRPVARSLQFVFYVYCNNDLMNIYENKLISVDGSGGLVFSKRGGSVSFGKAGLSKLYLTYLFLEVKGRFMAWLGPQPDRHFHREGRPAGAVRFQKDYLTENTFPEIHDTIKIYQAILRMWSKQAAAQNAPFSVVLLPFPHEDKDELLIPERIDRLNLFKLFNGPHPFPRHQLKFQYNDHWNEYANMLAAYFLYRDLEPQLGIAPRSDEWIKERLFEYYSAFDKEWFPDFSLEKTVLSTQEQKAIRHKYKALEDANR